MARLCVSSLAAVLLAFAGCESPYPIAPTPCDDWCVAIERAGCPNDNPFECVAACERELRPLYTRCESAWTRLSACYRAEPAESFFCQLGVSRPGPICEGDVAELVRCVAPADPDCIEHCLRRSAVCGGERPWACAETCAAIPAQCSAASRAMYQCYARAPITCARDRNPNLVPVEDEQCLPAILEYLDCTGFPKGDAGVL
jgi:hypothetical protein